MLWLCETQCSKAREIGVGESGSPLSDNLKAKLFQVPTVFFGMLLWGNKHAKRPVLRKALPGLHLPGRCPPLHSFGRTFRDKCTVWGSGRDGIKCYLTSPISLLFLYLLL